MIGLIWVCGVCSDLLFGCIGLRIGVAWCCDLGYCGLTCCKRGFWCLVWLMGSAFQDLVLGLGFGIVCGLGVGGLFAVCGLFGLLLAVPNCLL